VEVDYNHSNEAAKTTVPARAGSGCREFSRNWDLRRRLRARSAADRLGSARLGGARFSGAKGFVHDAADGASAAPALRAAAEALIDLARRARRIRIVRQRGTHVLVGQDVTGTDNHLQESPAANWFDLKLSLAYAECVCKEKTLFVAVLIFVCVINAYVFPGKAQSGTRTTQISAIDIAQRLKINLLNRANNPQEKTCGCPYGGRSDAAASQFPVILG
jgi:hypothetical protein